MGCESSSQCSSGCARPPSPCSSSHFAVSMQTGGSDSAVTAAPPGMPGRWRRNAAEGSHSVEQFEASAARAMHRATDASGHVDGHLSLGSVSIHRGQRVLAGVAAPGRAEAPATAAAWRTPPKSAPVPQAVLTHAGRGGSSSSSRGGGRKNDTPPSASTVDQQVHVLRREGKARVPDAAGTASESSGLTGRPAPESPGIARATAPRVHTGGVVGASTTTGPALSVWCAPHRPAGLGRHSMAGMDMAAGAVSAVHRAPEASARAAHTKSVPITASRPHATGTFSLAALLSTALPAAAGSTEPAARPGAARERPRPADSQAAHTQVGAGRAPRTLGAADLGRAQTVYRGDGMGGTTDTSGGAGTKAGAAVLPAQFWAQRVSNAAPPQDPTPQAGAPASDTPMHTRGLLFGQAAARQGPAAFSVARGSSALPEPAVTGAVVNAFRAPLVIKAQRRSRFRQLVALAKRTAASPPAHPSEAQALLDVLRPSDVALLRLMQFKAERALAAASAASSWQPGAPRNPPGGRAVSAAASTGAATAGRSAVAPSLGLDAFIDLGRKLRAAEAARGKARTAGQAGSAQAGGAGMLAASNAGGTPAVAALGQRKRLRLVRLWVLEAAFEASRRHHGAARPNSRVSRQRHYAPGAPSVAQPGGAAGFTGIAGEQQPASLRDAVAAGTVVLRRGKGRPTGLGGKRHLTTLKKAILQQRVQQWLADHPREATVYNLLRSAADEDERRVGVAEAEARRELKAAALSSIRDREAARLKRAAARGKVAPKAPIASVAGRGQNQSASTVVTLKQLRKEMRRLVGAGKARDPSDVVEEVRAKIASERAAGRIAHGRADAVHPDGAVVAAATADATAEAQVLHEGAATARARDAEPSASWNSDAAGGSSGGGVSYPASAIAHLAGLQITGSTRKQTITAALARLAPASGGAGDTACSPSGGAPAPMNRRDGAGRIVARYVDQDLSRELDEQVAEMISTAYFFQERARTADERKSALRRRLVAGLREVERGCRSGKLKLVVIAPNVEQGSVEVISPVEAQVAAIITAARGAQPPVPVVFALSRKALGAAMGSTLRVSAVGFYTFEALRGLHTTVLDLAMQLRATWRSRSAGEPPTSRAGRNAGCSGSAAEGSACGSAAVLGRAPTAVTGASGTSTASRLSVHAQEWRPA
jgi:ribosomal protein L7Ae-like RNA K-turn-binding protein